jgi:hypothetical protein
MLNIEQLNFRLQVLEQYKAEIDEMTDSSKAILNDVYIEINTSISTLKCEIAIFEQSHYEAASFLIKANQLQYKFSTDPYLKNFLLKVRDTKNIIDNME